MLGSNKVHFPKYSCLCTTLRSYFIHPLHSVVACLCCESMCYLCLDKMNRDQYNNEHWVILWRKFFKQFLKVTGIFSIGTVSEYSSDNIHAVNSSHYICPGATSVGMVWLWCCLLCLVCSSISDKVKLHQRKPLEEKENFRNGNPKRIYRV